MTGAWPTPVGWAGAMLASTYPTMSPSISASSIATTHAIGRVVARRMFCLSSTSASNLLLPGCLRPNSHPRTVRGQRHQENYGVGYWFFGV